MSINCIVGTTHLISSSSFKGSLLCLNNFCSSLYSTVTPPPTTFNSQVFFTHRDFFCRCWKNKKIIEKKKMCPHVSLRAHTKIAVFKKRPTATQSRQDCGMETCGSKSTTDWISWLWWMKGICGFVTWFSTVTEWAFSPCPDCRPLRLNRTEATAFVQDRLGHHDSSIFRGILNNGVHSMPILGKWKSWGWRSERKHRLLKCQHCCL